MFNRTYLAELGSALALYLVLLVGSLLALRGHDVAPGWNAAISLVPMLGLVACVWAIMRQLGRLDELQRKVQLDALALAVLGTAIATLSYGFLENVGFPRLSMFVVWPLIAGFWMIGGVISHRRYRP